MSTPSISPETSAYLDNALNIMEKNAIHRNRVDWDMLRTQAYQYAHDTQTPSETYAAIEFALSQLGDRHSYFLPPDRVTQLRSATVNDNPSPRGALLEGRVGYVFVPRFSSHDVEQINKFATTLQQIIKDVDVQNPCGWIVDLRENGGGNMWPMLAGIGPILGEGQVGAFVYPEGQEQRWYYTNGVALLETWGQAKVNGVPYHLNAPSPPVAVLTSKSTTSSGEAIVVSFRGRPKTRSFGEGTRGVPTCNQSFPLDDGARILLTVASFADRTGRRYEDVIAPDEVVDTRGSESDPVLYAAVKWLMDQ